MKIMNKFLTKSNSYNYYKNKYEEISNKNKALEKEIKSLKKEIKSLKLENESLEDENKNLNKKINFSLKDTFHKLYGPKGAYCDRNYFNFYLDDDFEDNLKNITKHLDSKNKQYYKYLILRSCFVHMAVQDNLYTENELEQQRHFSEFKDKHIYKDKIGEFKFEGGYNLHPFVDLGLDGDCLEFLKEKDIIDAGAFTGDTSLPLSKITSRNVYAFEPFQESYDLLIKNIENNNISNIVPIKKSLGDINGERTLYIGNNVQGITSNENLRPWNEQFVVEEITIDKFVEENNLDVGFIIVDVEGAELNLLKGAINTIKTQKPILTISIYHQITDFTNIIPWIANLDLGYEFEIINEGPWSLLADKSVQCVVRENLE